MYLSILSTLILFAVTIFLYVYWYIKKSHKFFDQYGIPYSKPHWFYGHMKELILTKVPLWTAYQVMYKKHSSERFAGVYTFNKPTVMIRDPELIKSILVKDFFHFHDRGFPIKKEVEPMSDNLLSMKGEEWKNLRIKLTGTFTSGKMKAMFPLVKKCADEIKPTLTKYFEQDQDFDMKDFCARYATDVIASCAFGIDACSLQNPKSEFREVGKGITRPRWRLLMRFFFPNIPSLWIKLFKLHFFPQDSCDYFKKIVQHVVQHREQNNITRGDFLDMLIAMKNNKELEKYDNQKDETDLAKFIAQVGKKNSKNDVEMTIETIAAQSFLFFIGGFEGPSNTLMFMLYALAEQPDIQNKLRQQILFAIERNGGEITYDIMKNIPYLDMVIDETLRKFPVGGVLFRLCTEDYKIPESNAVIKKSTPVVIPTLGLQYDEKYFQKPNEFYPEHFSSEAKRNRHHFAFLPFGEGPRVCIAERFGRMQIIVGIIHLLKDFSFELSSKTKVPLEYQTTGGVAVKGGIWLRCRPL